MADQTLPTNKVFINMTALRHNLREVKEIAGDRQIMAVVKADGYGHGLVGCSMAFFQAGVDCLGVLEVCDGITLREHGLSLPIHILGGLASLDQVEPAIIHDLVVFANTPEQVRGLSEKAVELGLTAKLHIKVDTGLGRHGLAQNQVEPFLREALKWPNIQIQGLATQLATFGDDQAHSQLKIFDDLCYKANRLGLRYKDNNVLNSSGLTWHNGHPSPLVRVGLMLYGIRSGQEILPVRPDLRPAMTVLSRVTQVRGLSPGNTVGPGRSYVVQKPMRLAMVPFGYAHGLSRSRSGRGWVLIRGCRAPLVGMVSMSVTTYDVTDIPGVAAGDKVVILGRHTTEQINAVDLAAWSATTPYEILTLLGRLNPRYIEGSDYEIYMKEGTAGMEWPTVAGLCP